MNAASATAAPYPWTRARCGAPCRECVRLLGQEWSCPGLAAEAPPVCHVALDGRRESPVIDDGADGLMLAPGQERFWRAGPVRRNVWAAISLEGPAGAAA